MANVYIKTAEGGETTSPVGTEGIPLDDGENSTWISINNIAEYIRTLTQTLKNKTLTTPTIASFTNAQHDHSNAAGGGAVSGDWTIVTASVTTANVTGVEGTLHVLDVSGMTANRDYVLPTPSAAGKRCGVRLSVGDATYALLLKVNSSEVTRIFITGEIVVFVATGTDAADWVVEINGKIPCVAKITSSGGQTISTTTQTTINLDTSVYDNSSCADTANDRIVIRRTAKYRVIAKIRWNGFSAAATRALIGINDIINDQVVDTSCVASSYPTIAMSYDKSYTVGDTLNCQVYQNSGENQSLNATNTDSSLSIQEIIE